MDYRKGRVRGAAVDFQPKRLRIGSSGNYSWIRIANLNAFNEEFGSDVDFLRGTRLWVLLLADYGIYAS